MKNNNQLPFCHSEVVAYTEFLSGLVEDGELGIITKEDTVATWGLYAGNNPPPSKLLTCAVCSNIN